MKKLIALTLLVAGLFIAQPSEVKAQGTLTVTALSGGDTNAVNTTAAYKKMSTTLFPTGFLNGYEVVSVQILITKRSGTTTGKAQLVGSIDGTNYFVIASDTMAIANQTGVQTYGWTVSPSKWKYYGVKVTGSNTLTMSIDGKLEYIYKN